MYFTPPAPPFLRAKGFCDLLSEFLLFFSFPSFFPKNPLPVLFFYISLQRNQLNISMLDYTKMPRRITDTRQRQDIDNDLRFAVRRVQEAVNALRELQGFTIPATADPAEWEKALNAATARKEKAVEAITDDPTLTDEERKAKAKTWRGWHKQLAMYCATITSTIHAYPTLKWTFDEATATITPTADIFALASDAATVDVPAEASDHALLLGNVLTAINGLRKWENAHNVAKQRLEGLLFLTEDDLAELWATGSILRDDTFATPQVLAARKFKEQSFI